MGMLGTLGAFSTAAWYCASTTVAITAIKAAPQVVEVVTNGVEEVVHEVGGGGPQCGGWAFCDRGLAAYARCGTAYPALSVCCAT